MGSKANSARLFKAAYVTSARAWRAMAGEAREMAERLAAAPTAEVTQRNEEARLLRLMAASLDDVAGAVEAAFAPGAKVFEMNAQLGRAADHWERYVRASELFDEQRRAFKAELLGLRP